MTRKADPRTARSLVKAGELPRFTPVPRQTSRHDGWTDERQRAFIEALADTGSVDAACRAVDMSQGGVYYLRRQPGAESFRKAWEKALELGVQRIEDVAMDRALNGVEVPVYSYGKLVGTRTAYNDRLLMFMLRNRAPGRFAAGQPKALNAVDQMKLDRIKKQWRAEWEAELRRVSPMEVRASIDRKVAEVRQTVETQRQREWEQLSEETRTAWGTFERLKARDLAALKQQSDSADGDSLLLEGAGSKPQASQGRPPARSGDLRSSSEAIAQRGREDIASADALAENKEPESNTRWRTIKDEGWE